MKFEDQIHLKRVQKAFFFGLKKKIFKDCQIVSPQGLKTCFPLQYTVIFHNSFTDVGHNNVHEKVIFVFFGNYLELDWREHYEQKKRTLQLA